jgi:hypothetical protein
MRKRARTTFLSKGISFFSSSNQGPMLWSTLFSEENWRFPKKTMLGSLFLQKYHLCESKTAIFFAIFFCDKKIITSVPEPILRSRLKAHYTSLFFELIFCAYGVFTQLDRY